MQKINIFSIMKFLFTVALPYDLNCVIYLIQIIIDIAIGRFIYKNYTFIIIILTM